MYISLSKQKSLPPLAGRWPLTQPNYPFSPVGKSCALAPLNIIPKFLKEKHQFLLDLSSKSRTFICFICMISKRCQVVFESERWQSVYISEHYCIYWCCENVSRYAVWHVNVSSQYIYYTFDNISHWLCSAALVTLVTLIEVLWPLQRFYIRWTKMRHILDVLISDPATKLWKINSTSLEYGSTSIPGSTEKILETTWNKL